MRVNWCLRAGLSVVAGVLVGVGGTLRAQTLATGDSRTVTEPTFPATCSTVAAQQAIVSGGPASETLYDTSRIQAALTACAKGSAVELVASGANNAFLTASLNLPSGVSLIVDGGVTLFASRRASDYQTSSTELCGSYGANGNGCNYLFTFNNGSSNTGSGIYGYGVIDGRGGSTILNSSGVDTGISWWQNADTATTKGDSQDNLVFMKPSHATTLTLYKITLRNSPMFHVVTSNVSGMTVWGVKIQAPFTAHNTDGVDPQGTNITITNTSISNGDDEVAVSGSSNSSNITISNDTTYSGHGISIGSYTQGGVSNMLVENVNMAGEPTDGNENGLRIKSSEDRGGTVQNITYENMCLRDIRNPLLITPFYNNNSGTEYPNFKNIVLDNVHVLPTTLNTQYYVSVEGFSSNYLTTLTLDNVVFDQLNSYTPAFQNDTITLIGNVYPASLQAQTGTGVTYTGSAVATQAGAYSCPSTVFPYVVGELYESTSTATNLKTATISGNGSLTLNAMVEPAKSQTSYSGTVGNYTGAAALTQPVSFYEGTTLLGTGTIGSNGTLAILTLSGVSAGTHTYTAQYPGDSNYAALAFGSVTLTVNAANVMTTTTLSAPSTGTFGTATTLSATVVGAAGSSGTPSGTVAFYDGTTLLTTGTLASGTTSVMVTLGGGSHSLSAVYSGDSTFVTSTSTSSTLVESMATSSTGLTASPTTVSVNSTTMLTATVTGVSGAAVPNGTVSFTDGTSSLGNATLNSSGVATFTATLTNPGARTITASYGGDGNYAGSSGTAAVQVTASSITTLTAPSTAVYGTATTISVAVTGQGGTPTGTVTFYDGTTAIGATQTLVSGAASISVKLAGGVHSLSSVYSGDMTYLTSTSTTAMLTVTTAASGTSLTASPTTVTVNGTSQLTATVTGVSGAAVPTGTVTFTDGTSALGSGTLNGSGVATLNATLPNPGARTIKASYGGDTNYAASSATAQVQVMAAASVTTLTAPASVVYGTAATLSVAVTGAGGTPTGSVTFYDGTTVIGGGAQPLVSGTASISVKLAGGAHSIKAVYSGDTTYQTSTSTTSMLTVTTAGSSTALTLSPTTITVGGTAMLTATVTGISGLATPTGTVSFSDGSTSLGMASLSNGVATLSAPLTNAGSRTITATYSGDTNYASSTGSASETVSTIATTTMLAVSPATTYTGASVVLTATVSPAEMGAPVTFLNGSVTLGTAQTNAAGVAMYTLSAGTVGAYSLSASVAAAGNYAASTSAAQTLTVVAPVTLTVSPMSITIAPGASGTVTAVVAPQAGFSGTPSAVTCTTAVSYVTCVPGSSVSSLNGTATTVTISVAATTGMLEITRGGIMLALLTPFGVLGLGLRSRKRLPRIALMLLVGVCGLGAMAAISGCGSSSAPANDTPTGTQLVTLSATAGGVTQTTQVTVTIAQ